MDARSVFHQEWLRSLREQYKHVVRQNDLVTLSSLTAVMRNVGFRDDELAQLKIEATMHVDDVGGDFSVDRDILNQAKSAAPHPAECACPDCVPVDESRFDADGQPITPDPEADDHETGHVFSVSKAGAQDEPQEKEPVTFADSVAAETARAEETGSESPDDAEDEGEPDPDAPQQKSLF